MVVLTLIVGAAGCSSVRAVQDQRGPKNSIGMEFAEIPAGEFLRGSPEDEPHRLANEGPQRTVRILRPFYMARHETTVGQFREFVRETGYRTEAERDVEGGFGINFESGKVQRQSGIDWTAPGFPNFKQGDDHPVLLTSWGDAEAFCRWLSEKEGRTYRLPTEAEWEYAARGGTSSAYWPGDDPRALAKTANVAESSLSRRVPAARQAEAWSDGHAFTAPVGSYLPNPYGLYDMHGNVWEWVSDWHDDDYYAEASNDAPQGPPEGRFRAIRGGGWFNSAAQSRSAQRIYFEPTFRYCLLSGFRVVLEAAPKIARGEP